MIALTIERREQENQRAQNQSANDQFDIRLILETGKHILTGIHGTDEVKTYQSASDA